MRITIDYNPENSYFSVLIDRGTLSNGGPPIPPPPPFTFEFAELTQWLNKAYNDSLDQFKDQKVAAIRFKYDPSKDEQNGYCFMTESETPPSPPPFIQAKFK
jgi:hypothetical protein